MIVKKDNYTEIVCDGCGEPLEYGWLEEAAVSFTTEDYLDPEQRTDYTKHYCDECSADLKHKHEFRRCMQCGRAMDQGMTNLEDFYACESCFEDAMDNAYPAGWRLNDTNPMEEVYEIYTDTVWKPIDMFFTDWF